MRRVCVAVVTLLVAFPVRATFDPNPTGNVVYVDGVYGSDAVCAREGRACRTIEAGLSKAASGDVVVVRPGNYTLAATSGTGITIPTGVVLVGTGQRNTVVTMNAVGSSTLVKFGGAGSTIRDIGLLLNHAGNNTVVGVDIDSTRSADVRLRNVTVTINATNAGFATAWGIHHSGTGAPPSTYYAVNNCAINVIGAGTGIYRGVYGSGAGTLRLKISNVAAMGTGNGSYVGVETAAGEVELQSGGAYGATSGGTSESDVLQTAGTIELAAGAYLETHTAGGKSFTAYPLVAGRVYADPANVANGTRYLYPGTATASTTQVPERLFASCAAFRLSINCRVAPGANTVTITLMTGAAGALANTALTTSLTGASTYNEASNLGVDLVGGNFYTVKMVANGTTAQDCIVQLKMY